MDDLASKKVNLEVPYVFGSTGCQASDLTATITGSVQYRIFGSAGWDRTNDIQINSLTQLPAVLLRNNPVTLPTELSGNINSIFSYTVP